jgi:hypothetical protein|tara:strand:+ start:237 stop:461 length:225 start_codon:yes stop_codon:yes gene_type:complete
MVEAIRAWNPRRDQTMMLKEVKVPPSKFFEIMSLARLSTLRAGKLSSTFRVEKNLQNMWLFVCIKMLINQTPWR